ncbi:MAG: hypothetical protein M3P48_04035, partial [Actinomycetota bacterium]|nr:hypothetical protein [Actinomycetota bacterium]
MENAAFGVPAHAELPLHDYDHVPLATLASRVRTLDVTGLGAVLGYEREHGNRLPVVQVLEARLDQLRNGAEPSAGSATAATPEAAPAAAGMSRQTYQSRYGDSRLDR